MIVLPLAQAASTALVRWAVLASGQRDRATARDPDKDLRLRLWVSLVPNQSHGPWNSGAEGRGCRFRTAQCGPSQGRNCYHVTRYSYARRGRRCWRASTVWADDGGPRLRQPPMPPPPPSRAPPPPP